MGLGLAFQTFFKLLTDRGFADRVRGLSLPVPEVDPAEEARRLLGEQLRLLAILQRDFLSEDLGEYSDAQIGSAVRDIHRDCKAALSKYIAMEPVLSEKEEAPITVPAGFDPSKIRLTGQIKGQPPYRGTVSHRGWRAAKVDLQAVAPPADPTILAPAEVEIT
jgi:hypothetical protein